MTAPPDQNETSPPTPPPLLLSVPILTAKRRTTKKRDDLQFSHQHTVAYKTEYEMASGHVLTDHPLL